MTSGSNSGKGRRPAPPLCWQCRANDRDEHVLGALHLRRRRPQTDPENEWVIQDVPELRIVDDDLWYGVQHRLTGIRGSARVLKAREKKGSGLSAVPSIC
jgi:hypothetical protein